MNILNESCLITMKNMESSSIDMIFTDPPYGTTDLTFDNKFDFTIFQKEFHRILKPTGWFFCFGDPDTLILLQNSGWKRKFEYIWVKPRGIPARHNVIRPWMAHEFIWAMHEPEITRVNDLYFDKKMLQTSGTPYKGHISSDMKTEYNNAQRQIRTEAYDNDGWRNPITTLFSTIFLSIYWANSMVIYIIKHYISVFNILVYKFQHVCCRIIRRNQRPNWFFNIVYIVRRFCHVAGVILYAIFISVFLYVIIFSLTKIFSHIILNQRFI